MRRRLRPATTATRVNQATRFLYAIGGDDGATSSALNTVEAAQVDAFGKLFAWRTLDSTLPGKRTMHGAVGIGRFLYLVGGNSGSLASSKAYRAQVLHPDDAPVIDGLDVEVKTSGLTKGVWTWRVAAKMKSSDESNPSGETLPGQSASVRVPDKAGVALHVTLSWAAVAGADKYLVYRTTSAGEPASAVKLIKTVSGTSFTDTGVAVIGGSPRELGDLGEWHSLASMALTRQGLGIAVAQDPANSDKKHIYAALGATAGGTVRDTVEYLTVTIKADGSQDVASSWATATAKLDVARWQAGAFVVDRTVTTRLDNPTDSWLYLGPGADPVGEATIGGGKGGKKTDSTLDAALVKAGGDLSSWTVISTGGLKGYAGYASFGAANQLFALGGSSGSASTSGVSGQLCGPDGPCTPAPGVKNFNAGIGLKVPRVLMGSVLESGRIFVAGGATTGGAALKSVESTVW